MPALPLMLLAFSAVSPLVANADSAQESTPPLRTTINSIVKLVNAERAKAGLQPLVAVPALNTAAQAHAVDMASQDYFDHTSLDGRTYVQRVAKTGYRYITLGENIAAGGATPAATMRQWMNSPGHRANILSAAYKEIGVGYARKADSSFQHYWVQDFGTAR
jgi:uncharacterized protein YkwD